MNGLCAAFLATLQGTLRAPVVLVAVLVALLLLALAPAGTVFGFHEQEGLVRDIGVSTILLGGVLVALCCGVRTEHAVVLHVVELRPASGVYHYLGSLAGNAVAAIGAWIVLLACGVLLLRQREAWYDERTAFLLVGGLVLAAMTWGAWRNYHARRSFTRSVMLTLVVISLVACVAVQLGSRGDAIMRGDMLLLQAGILALSAAGTVFAAVWAGASLAGRSAGMVAGIAVLVAGQLREHMDALPHVLRLPLTVCIPDLRLLWAGDYFYGDVLVLPWPFVGAGLAHALSWSCAVLAIGFAGQVLTRREGIRVTDLR